MVDANLVMLIIPIMFILGVFSAIKCLQLGLRWNMQTEKKQEPEIKSPIANITNLYSERKQNDINKYSTETINEWLHGKEGS